MNKLNIAGILKTYSEKCSLAETDKQLKKFLRDLKNDLKEEMQKEEANENEQI